MGYFPNGTAGIDYQDRYCDKCLHDVNQDCPIWLLHVIHSYEECNKPDSFLHQFIPRSKDGSNEQCKMFVPMKGAKFTYSLPGGLPLDAKTRIKEHLDTINRIIERQE